MIAIKGMEMPESCAKCPLRLAWCRERIYMPTRPERCPLIEVDDPTPRRVLNSKGGEFTAENWDGCRLTRYKCPKCLKYVRNDDHYCHKCGQHLMFPKIDFTPYVKGQRQDTIVTWEDEGE